MLSAISLEHTGTSILLACSKPCGMILSLFNHRNVRKETFLTRKRNGAA
jgi:hypothetical protein